MKRFSPTHGPLRLGSVSEVTAGTLGVQIGALDAGGVTVTETFHDRGLRLTPHHHARASLNITLSGCYSETFRGTRRLHPRLHMIVKPPNEAHANEFIESSARSLLVEIAPARLGSLQRCTSLLSAPRAFDGSYFRVLVGRICAERRRPDAVSPLVVESLVLDLFAQLSRGATWRAERRPPAWLVRARDEALSQPPRGRIELNPLAASAGVHASHLARAFRAQYGMSIGAFVRRHRLLEAADRLVRRDVPISEIALDAGFYDQSHFAKAFRAAFGLTASEFRRNGGRGTRSGGTGRPDTKCK